MNCFSKAPGWKPEASGRDVLPHPLFHQREGGVITLWQVGNQGSERGSDHQVTQHEVGELGLESQSRPRVFISHF